MVSTTTPAAGTAQTEQVLVFFYLQSVSFEFTTVGRGDPANTVVLCKDEEKKLKSVFYSIF
jgi:hypothetical protein